LKRIPGAARSFIFCHSGTILENAGKIQSSWLYDFDENDALECVDRR